MVGLQLAKKIATRLLLSSLVISRDFGFIFKEIITMNQVTA